MGETDQYKVGRGKPPLETRFGQPNGNPQGKTAEQKRLEMKNAETAMAIREKLLDVVRSKLESASETEALGLVEAAVLKLIKDSEDRGLGAPKAAVDHTSSDGSMTPQVISRTIVDPARDEGS